MRRKLVTTSLIAATALFFMSVPHKVSAVSGQAVVGLTNQVRASSGLAELAWRGELASSAWLKAQDICAQQYWAHTAPDGTTAWQLMAQSGYNYVAAGENLAKGFVDDAGVVGGWMASPGHRANILNTTFTEIGVGSANCMMDNIQTTVVVAHYGASATVPPQNQPQTPSAATKALHTPETPSEVLPAAPTVPTVESPAESLGSMIWRLSHQTYAHLFID